MSLLLVETRKLFYDTILENFLGSSLGVTPTITKGPHQSKSTLFTIFNPYFIELQ